MADEIRKLEEKLNKIIDDEIEKEDIDCLLVSESVDGLLRLEDYSKYVISFSEMDRRLNKIYSEAGPAGRSKRLSKTVKIILVAAVIAALVAAMALAYTGIRYRITDHKEYSYIWSDVKYKGSDDEFVVGYIPEGYKMISEDQKKYTIYREYINNSNGVINIMRNSYVNTHFNSEFDVEKSIELDGIELIVYGNNDYGRGLLFVHNNSTYIIQSTIEEDELLKIAQSIVENN